MAGSSYEDEDSITNINVTPFVDVVLVLLVIFMVTAKLIVSRGVHIDKPKAAAGGEVASSLRISVDKAGGLFVNGEPVIDDASAITKIAAIAKTAATPKAIIEGDRATAYAGVMRAINLAWRAGVTSIALTNDPESPTGEPSRP
jgi:biopolymer transport protein ExbD